MDERRYDDEDVRRIFEIAAREPVPRPGSRSGTALTLSDVQSIGAEVGVDAAAVARAAASLDTAIGRPPRRSMGMRIEVGRVVPLARPPTDPEWERLVTELRTTFGARGKVSGQGGLREWGNGNLHALVEPGPEGYQLRLGTVKGDAAGLNALGTVGIVAGAAVFVSMVLSGELAGAIVVPTIFGTAGVSAFLANMLRLPRWASRRAGQMEYIAGRAQAIVSASGGD